MKGMWLPYGASILIIGFAVLVTGSFRRDDILENCGITKEKDAPLHSCLSKYLQQKREALENLRNSAGKRNYTVLPKLFRESLKCFPKEKTTQKICYLKASYGKSRPNIPRRGSDGFSNTAASMYYGFRRITARMLVDCKMNRTTSPGLFRCLRALDPKAQRIIAFSRKNPEQAFANMAELISSSKYCYSNISAEQGTCLLDQNKIYQKNLTDQVHKQVKDVYEKMKKCGISEDIIDTVMGCLKPKAEVVLQLSLKMYANPELAKKLWNLVEEMKACVTKYPEVKKCLAPGMPGRPPRRPARISVNPFHFESVTGMLIRYISSKSAPMFKECRINPRKSPGLFMCMKKKFDENKDVQSKDPRKKFIAMMELMNTTAECFENVTSTQALCLYKNKQEMVETVNDNAVYIGKIMNRILGSCNATSEIFSCVNSKEARLQNLAKTLLTNPATAQTVWSVGDSLKDCLKNHPAIEKCVLTKNKTSPFEDGKLWRKRFAKIMQNYIKDISLKLLADCKLTPRNSTKVFSCLRKKSGESKNLTSQDPKQVFISWMTLINTSFVCFNEEQTGCLTEKKKEMQQRLSKKMKLAEQVMDQALNACGVNASETPDLVKCFAPKRSELQTSVPELLNNPAIAEPVWDLMVDTKKCFESRPDIMTCIKEQKNQFWMSQPRSEKPQFQPRNGKPRFQPRNGTPKFQPRNGTPKFQPRNGTPKFQPRNGKPQFQPRNGRPSFKPQNGKPFTPNMGVIGKLQMLLKKCGISSGSTPALRGCLQPVVNKLTGLYFRRDMDTGEKIKEFRNLEGEANKCFADTDGEMKSCFNKRIGSLRNDFFQEFQKKARPFDPKDAMASMDDMYNGCGITKEQTPKLKDCLDQRTRMVMELKPWLPMSTDVREKLKEEGKKYWTCFQDRHVQEKKCMQKIIDGFRRRGQQADTKPKENIQDIINKTKSEVLACSINKCFRDRAVDSADKLQAYLKDMQTKGKKGTTRNGNKQLRQEIIKDAVGALLCLGKDTPPKRIETFKCINKVMNETSDMAKRIMKRIQKIASKTRRRPRNKRAIEDDNEKGPMSFFQFMDDDANDNEDFSVTVFQLMFNDQSMGRVEALVNLMKAFISTCTSWSPPPKSMRNRPKNDDTLPPRKLIDHGGLKRQIIDHGGLPARPPPSDIFEVPAPAPTAGSDNLERCKTMYDDINTFIDTGNANFRTLQQQKEDQRHEEHHESSAVIIAVCTGSVIVGILVLLTLVVIFVARRRCQKRAEAPRAPAPTAPPAIRPPVYTTFQEKQMREKQLPPSYSECLDTDKYLPSATGLSQILSTSTREEEEGTEKSC